MSTQSTQELLASALASNDKARIVGLVDDLVEENAANRAEEVRVAQLARAIQLGLDDGSPDFDAVATYGETHAGVMEARKALDRVLIDYLDGDATASEAEDAVNTSIARKDDLEDAAADVRSLAETASIPPTLALDRISSRTVPKGQQIVIGSTVRNLGDRALDDLTVTIDGDLALTATSNSIASLGARSERDLELTGTAAPAGQFQLQLAVSNDQASESTLFAVSVLAKGDYLHRARQQTQNLQDTLAGFDLTQPAATDGGPGGGPGGGGGGQGSVGGGHAGGQGPAAGLANKLETIEQRLNQLIKHLEAGRPNVEAIDNQIGSVINTYGAFINQVEGMEGNRLTAFQAALLGEDARRTVETLEKAQEAEV